MCNYRFVDDDGNTYNPAKKITGPYGSTYVFAGPKVYFYVYLLHVACVRIYMNMYACGYVLRTCRQVYHTVNMRKFVDLSPLDTGICKAVLCL